MSEQPGRYHRSVTGLAAALVVLVGIVVVLVLLQKVNNAAGVPNPAPAVPYAKTVTYVRQQPHLHLVAPPSLPKGWRATTCGTSTGRTSTGTSACSPPPTSTSAWSRGSEPVRAMVQKYVDPQARALKPVDRRRGVLDACTPTPGATSPSCRQQGEHHHAWWSGTTSAAPR